MSTSIDEGVPPPAPEPPTSQQRWVTKAVAALRRPPILAAAAAGAIAIVLAVALVVTAAGKAEAERRLNQAFDDLADLRGQVRTLTASKQTLEADKSVLEDRVVANEKRLADVQAREDAVKASEAELAAREAAVTKAEEAKEANTIHNGTWVVGVDVAPGQYRLDEAFTGGMCYWAITRSGSNGDDIVANDIVTGGRPQVTLRKGQDFESSDCGTWSKVG